MKKLLLILVLSISVFTQAQITITEWDIVDATDQVVQNSDTLPTIPFPASGTNMSWDMTALNMHDQSNLSFGAPGWFNNGSFYPNATLGASDGGGFELFFSKSSSSFGIVGFAGDFLGLGGGDMQIHMNPADEIIRFPANYNDSYSTSSMSTLSIPGSLIPPGILPVTPDSIVNKTYTFKDVSIDGWGELTTPLGTFPVLRQYSQNIEVDSTYAYVFGFAQLVDNGLDTTYSITFFSNDQSTRFPLAEVQLDSTAVNIVAVDWLNSSVTTSLLENSEFPLELYPNPAVETITLNIEFEGKAKLEIYNLAGKKVYSTSVSANETINIGALNSGAYQCILKTNDSVLYSTKLIKK